MEPVNTFRDPLMWWDRTHRQVISFSLLTKDLKVVEFTLAGPGTRFSSVC